MHGQAQSSTRIVPAAAWAGDDSRMGPSTQTCTLCPGAGDHESAARNELVLPDTGVCGGAGDFDESAGGCCAAPSVLQIGARPVSVG